MHFDVKEIVSAWISKIKPKEEQKILAEQRAEICNECPEAKKAVNNVNGTRYCGQCGCLLEAKVYSYKEGACPLGKWDEIDRKYRNTQALKVLKDPKKASLI